MGKFKMLNYQVQLVKRMSIPQLSNWIEQICNESFDQGYQKGCKDVPDGSIVIDPTDNTVVEWEYEEFLNMLLTIPWLDKEKAEEIIDKIVEYYDKKVAED